MSELKNKKICVALSGGRDSVALAHYLFVHSLAGGYTLCAVNCEHGIRGEESLRDTAFVKEFCGKLNLPLYCFSADCVAKAREERVSVESAARAFRYSCFKQILAEGKADVIATAHHADDNAETVLFNLCRGSSLSGLKGIGDREGFIRPFLSLTRSEIDLYIKENSLSYVEDSTNVFDEATRNIIRHKVLPVLKDSVPGAVKNISRLSALVKEDDELLYSLSKGLLSFSSGRAYIEADERKPLFMRAALTALKKLGIEKDYTYAHLLSVYNLLFAENGDEVSLPKGVRAVREYGKICLCIEGEKPSDISLPFSAGKTVLDGAEITVTESSDEANKAVLGGAKILKFNPCALPEGCVFRFRREGDVFKKFGGGTKKLKDFLIEKKIPRKDRDFIPLIACGDEVFAVCGVEISDKIKCADGTPVCYVFIKQ